MIAAVMERIVRQTIPAAVINNPRLDWDAGDERRRGLAGEGRRAAGRGATRSRAAEREPDERYQHWLAIFTAERAVDPYQPDVPTRSSTAASSVDREIPEAEVERAAARPCSTSPRRARASPR